MNIDSSYNETLHAGDEISLDELQEAFKQIKNRKAAGPDAISI